MTGYEDIIDMPRPISKRGGMSVADRAKIFSPFSALKGFEAAIDRKKKIICPKAELTEDMKEDLDIRFRQLEHKISQDEHPIVTVVYYHKDKENPEGVYLKRTGMAAKLDTEARYIQIANERIGFDEVYSVSGEIF